MRTILIPPSVAKNFSALTMTLGFFLAPALLDILVRLDKADGACLAMVWPISEAIDDLLRLRFSAGVLAAFVASEYIADALLNISVASLISLRETRIKSGFTSKAICVRYDVEDEPLLSISNLEEKSSMICILLTS